MSGFWMFVIISFSPGPRPRRSLLPPALAVSGWEESTLWILGMNDDGVITHHTLWAWLQSHSDCLRWRYWFWKYRGWSSCCSWPCCSPSSPWRSPTPFLGTPGSLPRGNILNLSYEKVSTPGSPTISPGHPKTLLQQKETTQRSLLFGAVSRCHGGNDKITSNPSIHDMFKGSVGSRGQEMPRAGRSGGIKMKSMLAGFVKTT